MKKAMTTVKFNGTPEQEAKLDKSVAQWKGIPGAVMPVLQEAQGIYGYLPEEVQRMIALKLEVPFEEVYGVVSFYSQFILNPKGETDFSICLGTACYVKGAGDIVNRISAKLNVQSGTTTTDGKYSLEATRCIGACGLAPIITVNGEVYGRIKDMDEVDQIVKKYTGV